MWDFILKLWAIFLSIRIEWISIVGGSISSYFLLYFAIKKATNIYQVLYIIAIAVFCSLLVDIIIFCSIRFFFKKIAKKYYGKSYNKKMIMITSFLKKYGVWGLVFHKFIPFFRTPFLLIVSPFIKKKDFFVFIVVGTIVWGIGIGLAWSIFFN